VKRRLRHCRSCNKRLPLPDAGGVIAAIDLPRLFDSQLIVFFGQDYFSRFFTRETPDQMWVALPPHRSLEREWSLRIPKGFLRVGAIHEKVKPKNNFAFFTGMTTHSATLVE